MGIKDKFLYSGDTLVVRFLEIYKMTSRHESEREREDGRDIKPTLYLAGDQHCRSVRLVD